MIEFEFKEWPKIPRLNKGCVVTEKIDGTNACVIITEDGRIGAQSRNRIVTPGKDTDNYGFARWVEDHTDELRQLGPGYHYGEWFGRGILRGYALEERRFALFNVGRWTDRHNCLTGALIPNELLVSGRQYAPACCHVVPVLSRGPVSEAIAQSTYMLETMGSHITGAVGFKPEGMIVYLHGNYYKVLLENDDKHKSQLDLV
jgi:hypothetical protein